MKKIWTLLVIAGMFTFAACQSATEKPKETEPVVEEVIEETPEVGDTLVMEVEDEK
ncbi:MAG: hypothetical protein U1C46_00030 [Bacteroidales bacterium]|nr:hypothetical protein [Bacteroidales bacterium]MDZ4203178.1 hypothetical protein [Bacteroidales bacterium]